VWAGKEQWVWVFRYHLRHTGKVKNANSVWLNGQPLHSDLSARLKRQVIVANDANCLAISEAADGAGAGYKVVFAVIIGTGCGGGVAVKQGIYVGDNGVAGEWGHNPCPGPMKKNSIIYARFPVIAAKRAVMKSLFLAPALRELINASAVTT
jgi:fructokinase